MKRLLAKPHVLNDLMLINGYSVGELADVLGVTISHISNIKNSKTSPSPVLAKRISELFGVETKDLFELKEVDSHVKH